MVGWGIGATARERAGGRECTAQADVWPATGAAFGQRPGVPWQAFTAWIKANGVAIQYIQPGKPNQNAYIERFNRTFRDEVLNQHLFVRLDDVREVAHWWMIEYNEQRPHQGRWCYGKTPMQTFIDTLPVAKEKLMQAA